MNTKKFFVSNYMLQFKLFWTNHFKGEPSERLSEILKILKMRLLHNREHTNTKRETKRKKKKRGLSRRAFEQRKMRDTEGEEKTRREAGSGEEEIRSHSPYTRKIQQQTRKALFSNLSTNLSGIFLSSSLILTRTNTDSFPFVYLLLFIYYSA